MKNFVLAFLRWLKNPFVAITAVAFLVQTIMLVFFYSLPDALGLSLLDMFSGKIQWQIIMAYGGILVLSSIFMFLKAPRAMVVYYVIYFFLATADYEVFRFSHQRLSFSFIRTYFHISNIFDSTTVSTLGGDALGSVLWVGLFLLILLAGIAYIAWLTVCKKKDPAKMNAALVTKKKTSVSFLCTGLGLSVLPLIFFLAGVRGEIEIPVVKWPVELRFTLGKHTLTSPILHIAAVETFEFFRDNEKINEEVVHDLDAFLPEYKKGARENLQEHPTYFNAPTHEYKAKRRYNIVFIFGESYKGRVLNKVLEGDTTFAPNLWKTANRGGLWFKNAFSGGYPTVRGTMSTYFGFPSHPNRDVPSFYASNHFKGFPEYLTDYRKHYVTVSNPIFDHTLPFVETFFGENWEFTGESTIPGNVDSLGVDKAIAALNKMPTDAPWFLLYNTISTHIPFYNYPESFAEKPDDPMVRYKNAVRYTDQQFGRFMETLSKRPDYENTVVILLGDHDTPVDSVDYKIPQPIGVSAAQIFMGIFSADTSLFNGLTVREDVASQLDIGPTIMDLSNVREKNHFWGLDLLMFERPENQPAVFFGENAFYLGFRDKVYTGGFKNDEVYKGVNYNFALADDSLALYWKKSASGANKVLRSLLRNDSMIP